MSIELMTAVWARGPKDKYQTLVLLALADHANDEGICWPKMVTLARRGRMSTRTVVRVIASLEKEGWLTREIRVQERAAGRKINGGKSNRYTLNAAKLLKPGDTEPRDTRSQDKKSPDAKSHDTKSHDTKPRDTKPHDTVSPKKTARAKTKSHVNESHVTPCHVQKQSSVSTESPVLKANPLNPLPPRGSDTPPASAATATATTTATTATGVNTLSWTQFKLGLKMAFADVPIGPLDARFTPLVPGTSDYDAAFRDMWLGTSDLDENGRGQVVVEAENPQLTEAGFVKYRSRIQGLMFRAFGFIPEVSFRKNDQDPA